jgi:hypothetical protein
MEEQLIILNHFHNILSFNLYTSTYVPWRIEKELDDNNQQVPVECMASNKNIKMI